MIVPSRFAFGKLLITLTMGIPLMNIVRRGQTLLEKAELRDMKGTLTDAFSKNSILNHLFFIFSVMMKNVGVS